jgi:hypothetical protein
MTPSPHQAALWHLVHVERVGLHRAAARLRIPVSQSWELLAAEKLRLDALLPPPIPDIDGAVAVVMQWADLERGRTKSRRRTFDYTAAWMRYMNGERGNAIARSVGVTPNAFYSVLRKIRQRLADERMAVPELELDGCPP